MASPGLSIVTINLNNLSGLEKTMKSVFSQTFKDYEYLVIDGGSTDQSREFILANEKKLSYWVSEKDQGIYNAMNKGIKKASGEYLLFLNSGDTLYKENTLQLVFSESLENAEIIYGNILVRKENELVYGSQVPDQISLLYMIESTLMHPSTFIKRSLFETYGYFNENLNLASDYEFFLKTTILNPVKTKKLSFPISIYDQNGLSSRPENSLLVKQERRMALEEVLSRPILELIDNYMQLRQTIASFNRNLIVRILKKLKII